MVDDLKDRMRLHASRLGCYGYTEVIKTLREAADYIEKIEAENARLRRSLPPVQNPRHRGGGAR